MVNIGISEAWIGLSDEFCCLLMCKRVLFRLFTEIPLKSEICIFDPV